MITVAAPAKVNLTLEVIAKRDDGYHEIKSIIQTISLGDILTLESSSGTEFSTNFAGWDAEQSLVSKAVTLFRETTGTASGISVHVEKHIPMSAGLGGDSSDAAAMLKGLNEVWKAGLSRDELHVMAEKLGSDVPFFLYGGTTLMEGRGEKVTPLHAVPIMNLVLVVPESVSISSKTGKLYAGLQVGDYTDGTATRRWVEAIEKSGTLPKIYNVFEKTAYTIFPGLAQVRDDFQEIAGGTVHLAGSGPVVFTMVDDRAAAETLKKKLKNRGMQAFTAVTVDTAEPNQLF